MSDYILTPEFRVSFPFVFKPRDPDEDGKEPKYELDMLFPADADLSALKKAAAAAARSEWGDDLPDGLHSPFKDQASKAAKGYAGYEAGCTFLTVRSKHKPGIVDAKVQDIIDQSEFYGGCWARATIRAYPFTARNKAGKVLNKGVTFELGNLQKVRDDEPFGNKRPSVADDFSPVEGGGTDPNDIFA